MSSSASTVDKLSSDVDIANAFSRKLQGLLNSDDDAASLLTLNSKILCSLSFTDLSSFSVSPGCVSEALAHLKLKKSDGTQFDSTISYVLLLYCRRLSLSFSLLCYGMAMSLSPSETVFYTL